MPKITSGSGVTINSYTLRPKARGALKLRSADLSDSPIIDPNYLGDPNDLRISTEGVKLSREIMRQSAIARFIKKEHFPGDKVRTHSDFEAVARDLVARNLQASAILFDAHLEAVRDSL